MKLPVGIQEFSEIRSKGFLYVDKTSKIFELVSEGKYYFLSRPRRFGKSLLVNTLRELFSGHASLFNGLWIEDKWDWEVASPVIHLDFSLMGVSELPLEDALRTELLKYFQKHDLRAESESLALLLRELVNKLFMKYGQQVVFLVDEYDKPILEYLDDSERANQQVSTLKSFYAVLKGLDAQLRFVLITGVSKFSKVSIFSDLNNLRDISTSKAFADLLGYTQTELEHYFAKPIGEVAIEFGLEKETFIADIKAWYDGYTWDGTTFVYNPFSILSFFSDRAFKNFWFETGTPTFLTKLLRKNFTYRLDGIELDAGALPTLSIEQPDISSLLFQTGYLTIKSHDALTQLYALDFPNKEVRQSLDRWLLAEFSYMNPAQTGPLAAKLFRALTTNDFVSFQEGLNTLFAKIPQDFFLENREKFYHAIIYLALDVMGFYVLIEQNSGRGRLDAVIKTNDSVYILDFKMDKSPEEALAQIKDRGYHEPFIADGKTVWLLGVNLHAASKRIDEIAAELA